MFSGFKLRETDRKINNFVEIKRRKKMKQSQKQGISTERERERERDMKQKRDQLRNVLAT